LFQVLTTSDSLPLPAPGENATMLRVWAVENAFAISA